MSIIFQLGNQFWIESHVISHLAVAAGATQNATVTLDRAGALMGYSCSLSSTQMEGAVQQYLTTTANGRLNTFGQEFTQLRSRLINDSAVTVEERVWILLLMRGHA